MLVVHAWNEAGSHTRAPPDIFGLPSSGIGQPGHVAVFSVLFRPQPKEASTAKPEKSLDA